MVLPNYNLQNEPVYVTGQYENSLLTTNGVIYKKRIFV